MRRSCLSAAARGCLARGVSLAQPWCSPRTVQEANPSRSLLSWASRRRFTTVPPGATSTGDPEPLGEASDLVAASGTTAGEALRKAKVDVFMQRVLTIRNQQDAADMIAAAVVHRTLTAAHLQLLLNCAKPNWFRPKRDVVSGAALSRLLTASIDASPELRDFIPLDQAAVSRHYDVEDDTTADPLRYVERVGFLLEAAFEAMKRNAADVATITAEAPPLRATDTSPSSLPAQTEGPLLGEAEYNAFLAAALAHADRALPPIQTSPTGENSGGSTPLLDTAEGERALDGQQLARLQRLSRFVWALLAQMEVRGFNVTNTKSIEVLHRLLEAFDSKASNAHSSATQYTTRLEYLQEQEKRLQAVAFRSGRSAAAQRPRTTPRPEPTPAR